MSQVEIRTIGTLSLRGPTGDIPLDEPGLVALIALLAIAGDGGVPEDELLLRLTPNDTPAAGRAEIARLIDIARRRLGDETIRRVDRGYAFAPGAVSLDVRVSPVAGASERTAFLDGFVLPDSPEFSEWLADARRRVEPVESAPPVPAPSRWLTKRRAVVVGGSLALVGALAVYLATARTASGFSTGDPLLVADVENATGDTLFDRTLAGAAVVSLQQSGRLRVYPRGRLPEIYRLMQIENRDTALTFELAKNVAERDGVRFVLGLQVDRDATGYKVTARLADVSAPDRMTTHVATAPTRNDVLAALDDVLRDTRRTLGETARDLAERNRPLPLVTTSSLEALRSYADGSFTWAKGDYRGAVQLWARAVDIDTGFAMAYGALGRYYYFVHDRPQGERYFAEAFKRLHRLTEREQLSLHESLADFRGLGDSSLKITRLLASRYPAVTTWYNYGTGLMQARRDSEAIVALKTALTYDPRHVNSYINLATVSRRLLRPEEALSYYARAQQVDSTILYSGNLNIEWGGIFVQLGRLAEAESAFTRMSRSPRIENRALGFRSLGYLALWRGRGDEAAVFYRQAAEASAQQRAALSEMRNRMLLATALREMGRDAEANAEVTRSLSLMNARVIEPTPLAWLAILAVKLGRVGDAQAVAALLRSRVNPTNPLDVGASEYVSGLLALAAQRPDSALAHVRRATGFLSSIYRLALEAEAFRALGQTDSAQAAIAKIVADYSFGYETQAEWMRAPLVLGDMLLAKRDTAGAVREYQKVLDQTRGAPPGMRNVADARARLEALRPLGTDRPRD